MTNTDLDFDDKIEIEVKYHEMSIEVSNYIDKLCFEFKAALKRISSLKEEISLLRQQDISQKEKIDFLPKEFNQVKENRDFLSKENTVLKKEVSELISKFSKGSETLKHILSIQIPYYNKSGFGFVKKSDSLIDFPKVKKRLKQRPHRPVYKNHFKRNFVKPIG